MSVFKDDILAGKVAFVTGGGSGIGRALAMALAEHGADVAVFGRTASTLEETAHAITTKFRKACLTLVGDVRKPETVEAALASLLGQLGKVDIVINNAAGNFLCPAERLSYNGFGTVLDIDTKGTWNVCKAAHAAWLGAHGGNILNITGTLQFSGIAQQLHFSAAKAGIDALTRTLAVEWGPSGIRVNAIAPGPIADTGGAARLFPGPFQDNLREHNPLRRLGTVEDVTELALFVLSEAGRNIHGAILVSDGGDCLTRAWSFPVTPPGAGP